MMRPTTMMSQVFSEAGNVRLMTIAAVATDWLLDEQVANGFKLEKPRAGFNSAQEWSNRIVAEHACSKM